MSSGNIIFVIHSRGKHYVVPAADADTQWNVEFAQEYVSNADVKWTRDRGQALIMAHNIDNKMHTENGVREIFIPHPKRKRESDASDDGAGAASDSEDDPGDP